MVETVVVGALLLLHVVCRIGSDLESSTPLKCNTLKGRVKLNYSTAGTVYSNVYMHGVPYTLSTSIFIVANFTFFLLLSFTSGVHFSSNFF